MTPHDRRVTLYQGDERIRMLEVTEACDISQVDVVTRQLSELRARLEDIDKVSLDSILSGSMCFLCPVRLMP